MKHRRLAACLFAAAILGVIPAGSALTVQAADCYTFYDGTGALTLHGRVDKSALQALDRSAVLSVRAEPGTVLPENCRELFKDFQSARSIDLSGADTSGVTDMSLMFCSCMDLISLNLTGIDTSHVTTMSGMFMTCWSLETLDVSGFDTSSCESFNAMFWQCSCLDALDVSGFDTSKVTTMNGMFYECFQLGDLDLTGFDTSSVTNMQWMFECCYGLESLDLKGFDTSNVTTMKKMFYKCTGLHDLDLTGFSTRNTEDVSQMFGGCGSLSALTLGKDFPEVTQEMQLTNARGWADGEAPTVRLSGEGEYAAFSNKGVHTYCAVQPPYLLGDVNEDGTVNANDAARILIAAARIGAKRGSGLSDAQTLAANVNGDKAINAVDASIVLRYAAANGAKRQVELTDFI